VAFGVHATHAPPVDADGQTVPSTQFPEASQV
jgi:hypothetical protein